MSKKLKTDKTVNEATNPACFLGAVSGCFILQQLITQWEIEADRIKAMCDDVTQPKSHRETFNHFLIQLLKCIGEAKVVLKNNR